MRLRYNGLAVETVEVQSKRHAHVVGGEDWSVNVHLTQVEDEKFVRRSYLIDDRDQEKLAKIVLDFIRQHGRQFMREELSDARYPCGPGPEFDPPLLVPDVEVLL